MVPVGSVKSFNIEGLRRRSIVHSAMKRCTMLRTLACVAPINPVTVRPKKGKTNEKVKPIHALDGIRSLRDAW